MRYRLRTLMIVLALGPMVLECVGCSSRYEPPPGFFDRYRVPFPPEIRRVLDEPDRFTLFSIEGNDDEGNVKLLPFVTEHDFHGFNILGKTEIADAQQRKALIKSLDEGIGKVTHGQALCFWPRHAITVARGETRFDFVICFECSHIHVLDSSGTDIFSTQTTDDPAAVFNQALASAHVPLAAPPSH